MNDIVGTVDIDQSGVSRHLRILHEGGLVNVRPDGQRRVCSLRAVPFRELDAWISGYRPLWTARLDRFGDVFSAVAHECFPMPPVPMPATLRAAGNSVTDPATHRLQWDATFGVSALLRNGPQLKISAVPSPAFRPSRAFRFGVRTAF